MKTVTRRSAHLRLIGAALCLVLAYIGFAEATANAATPVIVNSTRWLGSDRFAEKTEDDSFIAIVVRHDVGRKVTGLRIDSDKNGTDNTASVGITDVSPIADQKRFQGGYESTKVIYKFRPTSGGNGFSCNLIGSKTRSNSFPLRIRARLDNGEETASSTINATWQASGDCAYSTDYAILWNPQQSATQVRPGQAVTFQVTGDDPDSVINEPDFSSVTPRLRNILTGETIMGDQITGTGQDRICNTAGDNNTMVFPISFPKRGTWIVESQAGSGTHLLSPTCGAAGNTGWYSLGVVSVNSLASTSPTADFNATRPVVNGTTNITATNVLDPDDQAAGGRVQDIEWDLDFNAANGIDGFEQGVRGDPDTGLPGGSTTRSINTTGFTPGWYTVRTRISDNGASNGADNASARVIYSTQFLVNSLPPAAGQDRTLTSTDTLPLTLQGTDTDVFPLMGVDDQSNLQYSIIDPPDHGTLSTLGGTFGNQTVYDPSGTNYSGNDSFTYKVDDGYGGVDVATVNLEVTPPTDIDLAPNPMVDHNDRGATVEFSSPTEEDPGATLDHFECSLDFGNWQTCTSPHNLTDLSDGLHNFRVRAHGGDGTVDATPAQAEWVVDAKPSVAFTSTPAADSGDPDPVFEFTTDEAGNTVPLEVTCVLDNDIRRPCESPYGLTDIDDGPHSLTVFAVDQYGRETSNTYEWEVSRDGVLTNLVGTYPQFSDSADQDFEFDSNDPANTFECSLDGAAWSACTTPQSFTGLADGQHTFKVRAKNPANVVDETPASWSWKIDTVAPDTTLDDFNRAITNQAITARPKSNEAVVQYVCSIDGGSFNPCSSPLTGPSLADGNHMLRVSAVDRAGNVDMTPAEQGWQLDTVAPTSSITAGPAEGAHLNVSPADLEFEFAADDSAVSSQCSLDGESWRDCESATEQSYAGLLDGDHTFKVRGVDAAGNVEVPGSQRSWTVDTAVPTVTIASGPAGAVTDREATFKFASSEAGQVECSLDGGAWQECSSPQTYTGMPDGDHHLKIRATDMFGNQGPATGRSWKVKSVINNPLTIPVAPACSFASSQSGCRMPNVTGKFLTRPGKGGASKVQLQIDSPTTDMSVARIRLGRRSASVLKSKSKGKNALTVTTTNRSGEKTTSVFKARGAGREGVRTLTSTDGKMTASITLGNEAIIEVANLDEGIGRVTFTVPALRHALRVRPGKKAPTQKWFGTAQDREGHWVTTNMFIDPPRAKKAGGKGGRK